MWYELDNKDYKDLKEYVKNNSLEWDEFWNEYLWWNTETLDKQRNFYRNGDLIMGRSEKYKKSTTNRFSYSVNTYIPGFSISSGCIIMEWNE